MKTKNMKIKISLWALVGIMLLSSYQSCSSDFLDTSPSYAISSENIWTSASLATQAVTGVYHQIKNADYPIIDGSNPLWDVLSSIMDYDANWIGDLTLLRGNATPSNRLYLDKWRRYYELIHRANDVIANIDKVPDMSDARKAQYKAECRCLRAYFYFRMNILWRGVPLYLEPVIPSECTKPRSTEQEVWDAILADLADCINEPAMANKYPANSSDYGHVPKAFAYSLRGKVYMWLQQWDKAEQDFRAITTMGYSLFGGGYAELFTETNERCDEFIFSIQCINSVANTAYSSMWARTLSARYMLAGGWNNHIPNPSFVDSYEEADGQPFNWESYLPGYSSMTPAQRSVFFLRDGMTEGEITTMTNLGADMSKYIPNGNEARIKAAYANRDPRLNVNIITPYSTVDGGAGGNVYTYTLRWPYRGFDSAEPFDIRMDTYAYYLYLVRKWVPKSYVEIFIREHSAIDIPLLRYADVLLNLAECLNEQNKTNEAITYVNLIRERSGVQLLNSNTYTTVSGQANMRERIRNERYWEMPVEEYLFWDELRWKTWKDKKFYSGNGLWGILGTRYEYTWVGDHNWTWPVPAAEMQMNSNLTQNPGWVN